MSGARVQRKTFFWQAALILLPVVVLALIGWASLRQDKILAEHDARERAQAVADQLLPVLSTELTASPSNESSNQVVLQIDDAGQLLFPPPYPTTPEPQPFSLDDLSAEQRRLWVVSQNAAKAPIDAIAACQQFIESKPPERFAAAAHYQLGVLLLRQNKLAEAADSLDSVAPDAVGESGLPLKPLAQFKMLQLQPFSTDPGAARFKVQTYGLGIAHQNHAEPMKDFWIDAKYFVPLDSFCSNIVYHPSALTPFLLDQAAAWFNPFPPGLTNTVRLPGQAGREDQLNTVRKWQSVWEEHERARQMFVVVREHLHTNSLVLLPVGTNKTESTIGPDVFWFPFPDVQNKWTNATDDERMITSEQNWIAARASTGTNGASFICRPESEFGSSLWKNTRHIPSYFSVGLEVAGKRIIQGAPVLKYWHEVYVGGGKGGGQYWKRIDSGATSTNLLASAVQSQNGEEQVKVDVYLTSPQELFATQQSRALAFGLLVIASTVAALIGLGAAWRAFHRQLRLAEMKSNFVSSVSHELRAPIASVRLMAESLEHGKVNEPQKQNEYFRFIGQECRRLSSLIENVLDFSRIEQGRKQYEFEPTDLLALTRETVKLMQPYAEEKGVRLETSFAAPEHSEGGNIQHPTSNIELEVDGRAIQQALVNLIDNAIKHSAKGQAVMVGIEEAPGAAYQVSGEVSGAKCDVSGGNALARTDLIPDTPRLALYVEDHGAGIPAAEHEKIFERFYRLGSELRRETQGVGIGLSIVKHIVEAHGGKVTVRSSVGQGSRFTIELPTNQQKQTKETKDK